MVPSLAIEAGASRGCPGRNHPGRPARRRRRRPVPRAVATQNGRLARARIGGDVAHLVLPDGSRGHHGGMPLGELIAAQRASGAPTWSPPPARRRHRRSSGRSCPWPPRCCHRAGPRLRQEAAGRREAQVPRTPPRVLVRTRPPGVAGRHHPGRLAATGRRAGLHRRRARRDHPPPAGRSRAAPAPTPRPPCSAPHWPKPAAPATSSPLSPGPSPTQRRHAHGTSMTEPLLNHK